MKKLTFLENRITAISSSLTTNDEIILEYLRTGPQKFMLLNITELAREIGTSVSAITRFVQKLGFEKLTNLKLAISKDIGSEPSKQFKDVSREDDLQTIVSKVIECNTRAITDISETLHEDNLRSAIELLQNAKRMIFTGIGGSTSVAQDAHHKFRRLGIVTELVDDVNSQMIVSTLGNKDDLIVVVSNEGANAELNVALKVAKENGLKILAITKFAQSPLVNIADVSLQILMHEFAEQPESLISRISSYCIIDILFVAYCMHADASLEKQLEKLTNSMKLLKNYES